MNDIYNKNMKFSIITCTYNSEEYLQDNIDSIESQTYKDYEHIFIDGFSSDKTIEIIKKYQQKYPDKVKLFQFEPMGIGHAMNKGIEKATGKYIMHLHSDDSLYNKNILSIVNTFSTKNENPEMIYGKAYTINVESNETMIRPFLKVGNKKLRFWLLLLINYIPHQSVFLKKEVFEKYGEFDESIATAMDLDLWIRLAKKNIRAKYIDEIICNFSIRKDSQSIDDKFNDDCVRIYKKHFNNKIIIKILSWIDRLNKFIAYRLLSITKM